MTNDIRISVLGEDITEWQRQALVNLKSELDINYTMIVGERERDHPLNRTWYENLLHLPSIYSQYGWWPLVEIEQKMASQLSHSSTSENLAKRHQTNALNVLSDAKYIESETIDNGAWSELPPATVDQVREKSDVALRFGFGLLRGEILSAPEYGVLSFHPADIRNYRGQGPEQTFINNDSRGGATLQQLNDDIDAGKIIAIDNIDVSDCYTLKQVWNRIRQLQIELLTVGVENIIDPAFEPWVPNYLGEYYSHSSRNKLQFVMRLIAKNEFRRLKALDSHHSE
jgi:methionyl-tRNA formyltransferase